LHRLRIAHRILLILAVVAVALVASSGVHLLSLRDALLQERQTKLHDMVDSVVRLAAEVDAEAKAAHQSPEEAQERARQAIRAMRWGDGDYYGVYRYDGLTLVHGNRKNEGVNRLNFVDASGKRLVAEIIDIAKAGGGTSEYQVPRASGGEPARKMAYVGRYQPWQWAIQAGVYIDDVDASLRAQALRDIGAISVLLALSGLLIFVIGRGISRPITALTATMQHLATGDTAVVVAGSERRDEVGAMARAVEVFRASALERQRLEAEADGQRRAAELDQARQQAETARLAEVQAEVVGALGAGLDRLSQGDLAFRLEHAFAPEYDRLREDYNAAVGRLRELVTGIVGHASGIRSGTSEIAQAADDLSRRTEQQAASLEETAAALEEITTTVRRTAEGAKHAGEAVGQARADADKSGGIVREAVSAMSEIEQSAQQISQIIGVIDEIAFQTNLLALNAGVEAARAGEAGRGFAVVASEVRALAQRSAEAAKEIKALISTSTQQVGRGVDLVGETGRALGRIVTQVAEISTVVGEIAASAQEQATGLAEVNTAVNQMDQVTQQNAAMVEQSTAASHALAQETEQLAKLTERFRLGSGAAAVSAPKEARPAQAAATRARSRPALKVVSQARKPVAAESWEEF